MKQHITLTISKHIAHVTFCRPEKLNALDFNSFVQLDKIITQLKRNTSIRLVLIQAEGPDFCTGLDVKKISQSPWQMFKLLFKWLPGNANLAQRVTLGWQEIKAPVICKIQGRCFGGGMQIALGADFRLASHDAQFAIMETRWGLTPDMAGSLMLQGLVNLDQALKMTHLANPISAQEAMKIGLITDASMDTDEACEQLIEQLLAQSPDALAATKRTYQIRIMHNRRKLLASETLNQIKIFRSKNLKRAISNRLNGTKKPYYDSANW